MRTGIIYSVGIYQRGAVIRGGRKRELTWKRLRPMGEGGGDASSSYNTPHLGIVIFLVFSYF